MGFERGEEILDLAVDRKAAGVGLGKNQLAVDDHVELTGFAGLDFGVLAEALGSDAARLAARGL